MEKILQSVSKNSKWYLLSVGILTAICAWFIPVIAMSSYGEGVIYDFVFLSLQYFNDLNLQYAILDVFVILITVYIIALPFIQFKYKNVISAIVISLFIVYTFIVYFIGIKSFTFFPYALVQLLFGLLYIFVLYSDKLLIKFQSHKQSPPNTKQKLETQEQQIADLQKQIDELKANHKTEK